MSTLALFTPSNNTEANQDGLAGLLAAVVRAADAAAPRSQQTRIGPSELGHACPRRIAYRLMGQPAVNSGGDPWPAIVGTATHSWLAEAFHARNQALGWERFLVEQRVDIREGLSGTVDLFDREQGLVIDHKLVGQSAMRSYTTHGPPQAYRRQIQLYGYGLAAAGHDVTHVALALYPRGGMLSGLRTHVEDFDPTVAEAALARHDDILAAAAALDVDEHPEHYRHIPAQPSHACTWCPWFAPGADTGATCPGQLGTDTQ